MKNPKTTSVLVGLGLVLVLASGYAQGAPGNRWSSTSINTFINDTGQAVSGLHIEYNTTGWLFVGPTTFADVQWDFNGQVNLSSGTVAAGGSVQISIIDPGQSRPRVVSWWWTDASGNLVGQTHLNGCSQPDCTSP